MKPSSDTARYLKWLAAALAIGCIGMVAGVVVIDPYQLHGVVDREGFNRLKPGLTRHQNEIKLTHAIALRPSLVFMGNSRAEIGFDPASPALKQAGFSGFNLAIPGTSIATAADQLSQLESADRAPKRIVLGLDFLDFVTSPDSPAAPATPAATSGSHPLGGYFWRFESVFSATAVKDAVRTLRLQHEQDPQTTAPNGFNPLKEYRALARQEGYYSLFAQRAQENAATFVRKSSGVLDAAAFSHLDAMLERAARSGITTDTVVYPYHAQLLAMFEVAGLWPAFENWKAQVVARIEAVHMRFPNAQIRFHDFSGYAAFQCEEIPSKADRAALTRWYWEGGHFKAELGEVMLERILPPPGQSVAEGTAASFGMLLTAQNLDANRTRIAKERLACLADRPGMFDDAAKNVAAAQRR